MKKTLIFLITILLVFSINSFALNGNKSIDLNNISPFEKMSRLTWEIIVEHEYESIDNKKRIVGGIGTAFFVKGKILTNAHVVLPKKYIQVKKIRIEAIVKKSEFYIENTRYYKEKIKVIPVFVKKDEDIAQLKIQGIVSEEIKKLIKLSESIDLQDDVNLGDDVYILGYPKGLSLHLQKCIVSETEVLSGNLTSWIRKSEFTNFNEYILDIRIQPGNSGGPVFKIKDNDQIIIIGIIHSASFQKIDNFLISSGYGFAKRINLDTFKKLKE